MAYKKPKIVARSAAKQTFVAGCGSGSTCKYTCHAHPIK